MQRNSPQTIDPTAPQHSQEIAYEAEDHTAEESGTDVSLKGQHICLGHTYQGLPFVIAFDKRINVHKKDILQQMLLPLIDQCVYRWQKWQTRNNTHLYDLSRLLYSEIQKHKALQELNLGIGMVSADKKNKIYFSGFCNGTTWFMLRKAADNSTTLCYAKDSPHFHFEVSRTDEIGAADFVNYHTWLHGNPHASTDPVNPEPAFDPIIVVPSVETQEKKHAEQLTQNLLAWKKARVDVETQMNMLSASMRAYLETAFKDEFSQLRKSADDAPTNEIFLKTQYLNNILYCIEILSAFDIQKWKKNPDQLSIIQEQLEQAIVCGPRNALAHFYLGQVYSLNPEGDAMAFQHFQRAIQLGLHGDELVQAHYHCAFSCCRNAFSATHETTLAQIQRYEEALEQLGILFVLDQKNKEEKGDGPINTGQNTLSDKFSMPLGLVYSYRGMASFNLYILHRKQLKEKLWMKITDEQAIELKKGNSVPTGNNFKKILHRKVRCEFSNRWKKMAKGGLPELPNILLTNAISDMTMNMKLQGPVPHDGSADLYYHRGRVYQTQGKFESAINDYEKAIQLLQNSEVKQGAENILLHCYYHCAKSYSQSGNPGLGLEKLDQAVERFGNDPWVYYYRAKFYQHTNQLHLALVDIVMAEQLNHQGSYKLELQGKLKALLQIPTKEQILGAIETNDLLLKVKIAILDKICSKQRSLLEGIFNERRGDFGCSQFFGTLEKAHTLRERYNKNLKQNAKPASDGKPVLFSHQKNVSHHVFGFLGKLKRKGHHDIPRRKEKDSHHEYQMSEIPEGTKRTYGLQ